MVQFVVPILHHFVLFQSYGSRSFASPLHRHLSSRFQVSRLLLMVLWLLVVCNCVVFAANPTQGQKLNSIQFKPFQLNPTNERGRYQLPSRYHKLSHPLLLNPFTFVFSPRNRTRSEGWIASRKGHRERERERGREISRSGQVKAR